MEPRIQLDEQVSVVATLQGAQAGRCLVKRREETSLSASERDLSEALKPLRHSFAHAYGERLALGDAFRVDRAIYLRREDGADVAECLRYELHLVEERRYVVRDRRLDGGVLHSAQFRRWQGSLGLHEGLPLARMDDRRVL